ncbi:MAG: 3-deoxy-manno-octulosonate cytidylyltransferase [Bacteroidota bacterium]
MVNQFLGIIPARYGSTRFPGKPLALLGNKPMIQWVWERASEAFTHLVVATDDTRIRDTVDGFGGKVVMTSADHSTGTERCAEAMDLFRQESSAKITHVVNIQGDEPLLNPGDLKALQEKFNEPDTQIVTLVQPLGSIGELVNPNVVKVVMDLSSRALYFSRSPIPFSRDAVPKIDVHPVRYFRHIGLYAFRADTLRELVRLPPSPMELAESLEQLRWLENGYVIHTSVTLEPSMGVDTPEDLEAVSKLL